MQETQILYGLDKLMKMRDDLYLGASDIKWTDYNLWEYGIYSISFSPWFSGTSYTVKQNSTPIVQKYGMDNQSELGQIVSILNNYFITEKARIAQDYDAILSELSFQLKQDYLYVPSELKQEVKSLFVAFPINQNGEKPKHKKFVPYDEQIPNYKFEMVAYICFASLLYGLTEYIVKDKSFLERYSEKYQDVTSLLQKDVKSVQAAIVPALNKPNFQKDEKHTQQVHTLKKTFARYAYDSKMLADIDDAAQLNSRFVDGATRFFDTSLPAYDKLVEFARWMREWRKMRPASGKYIMLPAAELLSNALGTDVQPKADDIKKYASIADYVKQRAKFVSQCKTL